MKEFAFPFSVPKFRIRLRYTSFQGILITPPLSIHWDLHTQIASTETATTTILEIAYWLRLQSYFITALQQLQGPFKLLEMKINKNQNLVSLKQQ